MGFRSRRSGSMVIAKHLMRHHRKSFSGFPKLKTIGGSVVLEGGSVILEGDFDNGTFSSLEKVSGGFNLTTSGSLSCDEFTELNSDGDIKGDKFYCQGASSTVSSSSSKSSSSGCSSSSTSSSSSSSAAGVAVVSTSLVTLASFVMVFAGVGAALY